MKKTSKIAVLAAAAVLSLVAGCHSDSPEQVRRDAFTPEDQPRQLRSLIIGQEASAARHDATLHAADFDNDGVNSLGQQKLDLMLTADEPTDPLVVFVDFGETQVPDNAHHSVVEFLKARGLPEADIVVKDGPNLQTVTSAAQTVSDLHALQASNPTGAPGAGASPGAPSPAVGSSGASTSNH